MRKLRKGRIMLVAIISAIILIILAILILNKFTNKKPEIPVDEEIQQVYELPETTYSGMEVKNIAMEYLKNNNETMITFEVHNTTGSKVEKQYLDAVLIGPNDEVIATMEYTPIRDLEVNQVQNISVIYDGDVTATKQIKLVKK